MNSNEYHTDSFGKSKSIPSFLLLEFNPYEVINIIWTEVPEPIHDRDIEKVPMSKSFLRKMNLTAFWWQHTNLSVQPKIAEAIVAESEVSRRKRCLNTNSDKADKLSLQNNLCLSHPP